ncbi:transducin beta-like protein 3 [Diaphorina citri]|uniref:Transducin beta-like protein 3 n=1 Tax=Diaphorina citri TaxID=121845 RepID=A0A1S3CZT6_DIACI|nr:transducin beta-like protein 3 [Diaphorina citri]
MYLSFWRLRLKCPTVDFATSLSASQDTTIKLWKFPKKLSPTSKDDSPQPLDIQSTEIGHEKDINCVTVSPNDKLLASGSLDKTVKVWSTTGGLKLLNVLRGHKSCGRDKVLFTWDLSSRKQLRSYPAYESLETCAVFHLSNETESKSGGKTFVLAGGEKSLLHYYETSAVMIVGEEDSHIVVASNTPHLQLYARKDMSCTLVSGHTDFVLTLATSLANRNLLLSGSKDNSIRLWLFDGKKSLSCVAMAATHTKSIMSVALSQLTCTFLG